MEKSASISHVGLDVHRKFSRVTVRDAANEIVVRGRLEHGDRVALRRELAAWPPGTAVLLEGSFGWPWIADECVAAGLDPHLVNSRKLAEWRRARGQAKCNRLDADLVSELWLQQPRWWESWLAPPEVRELRELLRHRMNRVRIQTALKNRIHARLHRQGVLHPFSDLFGTGGRRFLQHLAGSKAGPLSPMAQRTLKSDLQLLDHIRQQIATATREFRRRVQAAPQAERLRTIPGINHVLAYTLWAEIGTIQRFASARELAAYSLLVPRADESGDERPTQPGQRHVGYVGRRSLKWAFVQAAHGAVAQGGVFRARFNQLTHNGRERKAQAYVTIAHQLSGLVHVRWRKELDFQVVPPPRPGSRAARQARPVSGQPADAMVRGQSRD
jgi:transposase